MKRNDGNRLGTDGENWYYMSASGAMQTGRVQTHTGCYYLGKQRV